ncbi:hypothetical protein VE03_10279 [Pseudogymnoascus sp. 23342-1-I1]|nr:hypothetical protein VE03_10279 [Pseudogymnoascus sp. 23342-1-I1]
MAPTQDQTAFSTPSEPKGYRIFIIGAGVLGLSLLRHISSTAASGEVTAYDSNEKGAACDDSHKIVRTQYTSALRTEIAREADRRWTTDPILKPYYNRIGRIEITNDVDKLDAIDTHMPRRERLTLGSVKDRLNSSEPSYGERRCLQFIANILQKADNPDIQCIWNKDNAVIDWKPCMDDVRGSLEAQIREAKIEKLVVDGKGRISALQLPDKRMIKIDEADKVILTVGAWGENLLRESNISSPQKGFRAVGVFTFYLRLEKHHRDYLKDLPALSFQDKAINCEFLPPVSEQGLAKIGLTLPFRNKQNVPEDVGESDLMYFALLKALDWARKYYDGLGGAEIVYKGAHWDGVTEDQTPLISWHPEYGNLGLAWGASFTRAKDFPIIGRTIYEILFQGHQAGEYGWNSEPIGDKIQHNQPHLLTSDYFETLDKEAAKNKDVQELKRQGAPYYL